MWERILFKVTPGTVDIKAGLLQVDRNVWSPSSLQGPRALSTGLVFPAAHITVKWLDPEVVPEMMRKCQNLGPKPMC